VHIFDQCVLHKIIYTKKDNLDNRQNVVDCRMKHSQLPKSRFLLKIRRDRIQKGICVCACVYVTRVRITLLILQFDSMPRRMIYCELSEQFRRCLLRVFPLTVTILIADFRDFSPVCRCNRWDIPRLVHDRLLPLPIN